jgi:HD-GYP domain-containing protein (c-di-GMP phosphodiesterase class II)
LPPSPYTFGITDRRRPTRRKPPSEQTQGDTAAVEGDTGVDDDASDAPTASSTPDTPDAVEAALRASLPEWDDLDDLNLQGLAAGLEADEPSPELVAMARRLQVVLAPCRHLLDDALTTLRASGGVMFAVDGPRRITLLVSSNVRGSAELAPIERAALTALEARRALLVSPGSGVGGPSDGERYLAVPCSIEGDLTSVLVARRGSDVPSNLDIDVTALGSTLPLALAGDRARMHFALERAVAEVDGARRQLEAYAVDLRSVYASERAQSEELAQTLVELEETYEATVRGLATAVESKDAYTGGHLFRVSRYGLAVTALVAPEHADDPQFEYGFLLHDIGKLAVPDAILAKEGALTEAEWEQIRAHPAAGRNILARIPFLAGASEIVYAHHECWDGSGFPQGLAGDEIPLGARIFPLADAFDAMTTDRPDHAAMSLDEALVELRRMSGRQFWPDAVDAFLSIPRERLESIKAQTFGSSDR